MSSQLKRIANYENLTLQSKSFTIDGKRYAYNDSLEATSTYKPITEKTAKAFLQVVVDAKQGKATAQQLEQAIRQVQESFDIVGIQ